MGPLKCKMVSRANIMLTSWSRVLWLVCVNFVAVNFAAGNFEESLDFVW